MINQYASAGVHDYRSLAERDDVLTFDSPPLAGDMEVTGPFTRASTSRATAATPTCGRAFSTSSRTAPRTISMSPGLDVVRASYRSLEKGRQLLTPGQIYELRLDRLVTSNVFRAGHRVRVQISASFFPNFSRNLHTGDLESVSARRQKAAIRVYHDREHPSEVSLHVVDR